MAFFFLGHIFYVALLITNAIAILNEERFLAKIGWSTRTSSITNSGFGHVPSDTSFDGSFGGSSEGQSIKVKAINLISAVRTLMRLPLIAANVVVILYEIALG